MRSFYVRFVRDTKDGEVTRGYFRAATHPVAAIRDAVSHYCEEVGLDAAAPHVFDEVMDSLTEVVATKVRESTN